MNSVISTVKRPFESSVLVRGPGTPQEVKRCTNCGAFKTLEQFSRYRRRADALDLHCRQCIRQRIRNKKARQLAQGFCTSCGSPRGDSRSRWCCQACLTRDSGTRRSREMRAAVLRSYGGEAPACVCCGEQTRAFLTLDHVNNGGRGHRRQRAIKASITSCDEPAFHQASASCVSTATWRAVYTASAPTSPKWATECGLSCQSQERPSK